MKRDGLCRRRIVRQWLRHPDIPEFCIQATDNNCPLHWPLHSRPCQHSACPTPWTFLVFVFAWGRQRCKIAMAHRTSPPDWENTYSLHCSPAHHHDSQQSNERRKKKKKEEKCHDYQSSQDFNCHAGSAPGTMTKLVINEETSLNIHDFATNANKTPLRWHQDHGKCNYTKLTLLSCNAPRSTTSNAPPRLTDAASSP